MLRNFAAAFHLAAALLTGAAFAEEVRMSATLAPGTDVPAAERTGAGTVAVTFDTETRLLTWRVEFSGLTGPLEAAHFHGPAGPGDPTGTIVPIKRVGSPPVESPLEGSGTLDEKQAGELIGGEWHVKLHTPDYPDGEIRGHLTPQT